MLAGLFFGQIYWSIEQAWPGSLTGPDPVTDSTAVYYSFVTLATLGYGDYLPRSDLARGIATFEVIGGQLFLAVMVARLIGAFGTTKTSAYSAACRLPDLRTIARSVPGAGVPTHSLKST